MGTTPNISIGFNAKNFNKEVKSMSDALKDTQTNFKLTNAEIQTSGTKLDQLRNKYSSLEKQVKQQSDITKKYTEAVKACENQQKSAKERLEKANEAYAKGKTELKGNKDELQKLKDEVKKAETAVKSAESAQQKYTSKLNTSKLAEIELKNALNDTGDELKKQEKYIARVTSKYQELSSKTAGVQKGLSTAGRTLTATVTAPLIAGGIAVSKEAISLNKNMANISTLSIDDKRLQELKKGIQDISVNTAKYTNDISDGVYQVVSAFGDTNDTLKITEINAKAAKAGMATTTDAINLTSAVTKGYGDTSAEAVSFVADLAFKTAELGQTTFPELAASMGKVVPQSQALNVSQTELFSIFATLTGVTGNAAEVSTQLGAVYTSLMTPTESMKKLVKDLGYESSFAMVKGLGFKGSLDEIAKATGGSEEKLTALFSSKEAITAMLALTGAQADVFSEKLNKMGDAAGASETAFDKQKNGINQAGFQFEQSMVKMQVAAQKFGDSAAPFIDKAADAISGLSEWLSTLDEEQRQKIINTGIALAALGPALTIISKGISGVNGIISAGSAISAMFGTAQSAAATAAGASGVGGFISTAAGITAPFLGITALLTAPFAATYTAAAAAGKGIDESRNKLLKLGDTAKQTAEEALDMSKEAETVKTYYDEYSKLSDLAGDQKALTEHTERRKEIEQWFIDHYGDYISAEEKKNGVRRETIDLIKTIIDKEDERKRKELNEKIVEAEKSVPKTQQTVQRAETLAQSFQYQIDEAERLRGILPAIQKQYDAINKTMTGAERRNAIANLTQSNQAIFDSYDKLTGQKLTFTELGDAQNALTEKTNDWKESLERNNKTVDAGRRALDEYKAAAVKSVELNFGVSIGDAAKDNADKIKLLSDASAEYEKKGRLSNDMLAQIKQKLPDVATGFEVSTKKLEYLTEMTERQKTGGLAVMEESLTRLMQTMGLIPENKEIKITSDGSIQTIDKQLKDVHDDMDTLDGMQATVQVDADGNAKKELTDVQTKAEQINRTPVNVKINYQTTGIPTFDNFKGLAKGKSPYDTYEGFAVVNDGSGAEAIEDSTGNIRIHGGRNVTTWINQDDTVYTAEETQRMFPDIPHFATGKKTTKATKTTKKSSKPSFEKAKENFEYKQKTSEVTDAEALAWWKDVLKTYAKDADAVKQANIEIYSLSKSIKEQEEKDAEDANKKKISAFQESISIQEKNSTDWIHYQVKMNNMSVDDQIAAYQRMNENYARTLTDMSAACKLTAEEQLQAWNGYYEAVREREIQIAELQKQKAKEVSEHKQSLSEQYISERTYRNDWAEYGDDPMQAYSRIKERLDQEYADGTIPAEEEYNKKLSDVGQQLYNGRRENSAAWLEEQRYYNNISTEEYIQGLEREKTYTKEYYEAGLIDFKTYNEATRELNQQIFSERKTVFESYINDYYDTQKKALTKARADVEQYYSDIEKAEIKQERSNQIDDLKAQYAKYDGAVTIEGRKKLKEIKEQIDALNKEAEKEERDERKQAELDAIDDRTEALELEHEQALKGTDKYITETIGIFNKGNTESANNFNTLLNAYTQQQDKILNAGYENVTKIVDLTNQKLQEIANAEAEANRVYQSASAAQNRTILELNQNITNHITDKTAAQVFGVAAITKALSAMGV